MHYVNPVPGVGVVIEMAGGVVLVQRGNPPHKGEWALPGGFVEADESAEEAAMREAEEETGLKIDIVELAMLNSFPEGPPVSGIMIFYRARPVGGVLRAGDDAAAVRVFAPHELPRLPFRTHREMIARWLEQHTTQPASQPPPEKPALLIRPFLPADADEVLALLALIPAHRQLTEADWQRVHLRMLESPFVEVFVACTGDPVPLIIGFVSLAILRGLTDSVGVIDNMAVLPAYQRRGVGAELLESVLKRARALHLRALWVNRQRANDQARAFYAALGFDALELVQLKIR
ncbi:MAG: GNAT family N-acetyltransferase [Anaerolineae bacterium]|nr:GNAT family N-acetyltransferase [Anaerolineae bacterium]